MSKKHQQTASMWAVVDKRGRIKKTTVEETRRDAISCFVGFFMPSHWGSTDAWVYERGEGYRAVKVSVEVLEP